MNNTVTFDVAKHLYKRGETPLISVTQLLKKHGLAPDYGAVPADVLERKAALGTAIHAEIENYIKTGEIPDFCSAEFKTFIELTREAGLVFTEAEKMVSRDFLAGKIDLLGRGILADVKTSQTLDREYVRWQLSLYDWLYNNETLPMKLYAIHLPINGKGKIVPLEPIPPTEVRRLIEAEAKGEIYTPPVVALNEDTLSLLYSVETLLTELNADVKRAEERKAAILAELQAAMEDAGVTKYESAALAITYVAESTRETVDSAKLKREYPDVAAACKKTSTTKAYVKVKVKE